MQVLTFCTGPMLLSHACSVAYRDPGLARHLALQAWTLSTDDQTTRSALALLTVLVPL